MKEKHCILSGHIVRLLITNKLNKRYAVPMADTLCGFPGSSVSTSSAWRMSAELRLMRGRCYCHNSGLSGGVSHSASCLDLSFAVFGTFQLWIRNCLEETLDYKLFDLVGLWLTWRTLPTNELIPQVEPLGRGVRILYEYSVWYYRFFMSIHLVHVRFGLSDFAFLVYYAVCASRH